MGGTPYTQCLKQSQHECRTVIFCALKATLLGNPFCKSRRQYAPCSQFLGRVHCLLAIQNHRRTYVERHQSDRLGARTMRLGLFLFGAEFTYNAQRTTLDPISIALVSLLEEVSQMLERFRKYIVGRYSFSIISTWEDTHGAGPENAIPRVTVSRTYRSCGIVA